MSDPIEDADWQALAQDLHDHGIPERRAKIVALAAETDLSYQAIADQLGVDSKGSIGNQIREYREARENAQWVVEHAPEI